MFHRTSQKLGRSIVSRGFHSNRSTILSKSTPLYITFVAVGAVAFEFFYGKASETVWAYFNQGVSLFFSFFFSYLIFFLIFFRNSFIMLV